MGSVRPKDLVVFAGACAAVGLSYFFYRKTAQTEAEKNANQAIESLGDLGKTIVTMGKAVDMTTKGPEVDLMHRLADDNKDVKNRLDRIEGKLSQIQDPPVSPKKQSGSE